MAKSISELRTAGTVVKNEQMPAANTAARVGEWMEDAADTIEAGLDLKLDGENGKLPEAALPTNVVTMAENGKIPDSVLPTKAITTDDKNVDTDRGFASYQFLKDHISNPGSSLFDLGRAMHVKLAADSDMDSTSLGRSGGNFYKSANYLYYSAGDLHGYVYQLRWDLLDFSNVYSRKYGLDENWELVWSEWKFSGSGKILSGLLDTAIPVPFDRDILVFNNDKWRNATLLSLMDSIGMEVPVYSRFIDAVLSGGGTVDVNTFKSGYKNLNPFIKDNAITVLLPGAYSTGVVFGMSMQTGVAVPFNFSRASEGTYFDSNLNMQNAGVNAPRIDYLFNRRLLIEKTATNITNYNSLPATNSLYFQWLSVGNRLINQSDPFGTNHAMRLTSDEGAGNYVCWRNIRDAIPLEENPNDPGWSYPLTRSILVKPNSNSKIQFEVTGSIFNADLGEWTSVPDVNANNTKRLDIGVIPFPNGYYYIWETTAENINWNYTGAYPFRVGDRNPNTDIYSYYIARPQAEIGYRSSIIPTSGAEVTRSADLLQISLTEESEIYLKTDKQEVTFTQASGDFNIHEKLNNEGIEALAII